MKKVLDLKSETVIIKPYRVLISNKLKTKYVGGQNGNTTKNEKIR
jgi:hypothetical protein